MRIKTEARYELKYLIDWRQREVIQRELVGRMEPDSHGDGLGNYVITSLYYDSPDYRAYLDKVNGERFRRKVRLRVYGTNTVGPETTAFLEIKQRQGRTLTKKRVRGTYASFAALDKLEQLVDQYAEDERVFLDEVAYLHRMLDLHPACVVRYNRVAYNCADPTPDLRVTFDNELQCRTHALSLLETGHVDDRYFFPPTACVLEIKANRSVPFWLMQIVNRHGCVARRVSKYCTALERCGRIEGQRILI